LQVKQLADLVNKVAYYWV